MAGRLQKQHCYLVFYCYFGNMGGDSQGLGYGEGGPSLPLTNGEPCNAMLGMSRNGENVKI